MDKKLQYTKAHISSINKETGEFDVIASTADVDRDRETIDPKGWELKNFRKNPVILWAHNYSALPIGVAEKIEQTDKGLIIKGRFASEEANPFAQQVKRLYEEGIQKAVSVGFIPLERDEADSSKITKAELLELSFVPVPANPNALALAVEKGFDPKKSPELFEKDDNKGAVPRHETPKAPRDREWSGSDARKRLIAWAGGPDKEDVNFKKLRLGFAWFDEKNADNFTAYKLPHHDVIGTEPQLVWRGLIAAMAALLGARGGVDIPDADRQKVYNHLAKHYEQFDEEPPAFRTYSEVELKELFPEEKAPEPVAKKDVAETVALAGVLDHLDFLIFAFGSNEVSENVITMMRDAQALLLKALKAEASMGKKQFEITARENKPDLKQLHESISERVANTSHEGDGSTQSATGLESLTRRELIRVRKRALSDYKVNEVVLTITKRALLNIDEQD